MCRSGTSVNKGDVICEIDTDYIRGQNKPLITPVIFTSGQKITLRKQGIVHELEEDLIDIE